MGIEGIIIIKYFFITSSSFVLTQSRDKDQEVTVIKLIAEKPLRVGPDKEPADVDDTSDETLRG